MPLNFISWISAFFCGFQEAVKGFNCTNKVIDVEVSDTKHPSRFLFSLVRANGA